MARRPTLLAVVSLVGAVALVMPAMAQEGDGKPFQLGVQQNVQGAAPTYPAYPSYPAYPTVPQQPKKAPVQPPKPQPKKTPIKTGIQQEVPQQRPPIPVSIQQNAPPPGVLPTQFMGNWLVLGSRSKVEARPEFQNGIGNIFTSSNSQTWNIVGGPGGYSMSSTTGVQQVQVGQCNSSTAFLRYAHPVGNTIAQEAIVMQLAPDGQTFQGMQRITIMKKGEPSPRAQVTYQLMGRRQ